MSYYVVDIGYQSILTFETPVIDTNRLFMYYLVIYYIIIKCDVYEIDSRG